MAMSYTTLTGSHTTPGSIINWTSYNKLDVTTVVDEAQFLLFEILRVREMRTAWTFGMSVGQVNVGLPVRFLDPIGRIFDITNVTEYGHVIETDVMNSRSYDASFAGTFGNNPFTTAAAVGGVTSGLVNVNQTAHGFNQGSTITIPNAPVVDGLTLTGTMPITAIVDVNNFTIDAYDNSGGVNATAGGVNGGGAGVTYTGNNLVSGSPSRWAVWDEKLHFDVAFDNPAACKLIYYRRPILLSTSNPTNFLTDRYPKLVRVACLAAAAEYMKDDSEYQKQFGALNNLVATTAVQDDLGYRGASFGTDTPSHAR